MSKLSQSPLTRRAVITLGGAVALVPVVGRAQTPGMIIAGGPIYTGRGEGERAEAVVVKGDRIAYVGSLGGAKHAAPGAKLIDLAGAAAFPGFVDSHAHLTEIGLREMTLNLEGSGSIAELQARLRVWATTQQPAGPIIGRGWIETHWPEQRFPTRADLDAVVSDRPVYLTRSDGHAGVANSAAIAFAGISASTTAPAGGDIPRDAKGEPTGMFIDNAKALVEDKLPKPGPAMNREALVRADKLYRARGWTGVHNMSVAQGDLDLMRDLARGDWGLRIDNYMDPTSAAEVLRTGPSVDPTGKIRLRGIKLYADGALGSRGAALLAPYDDKPGWTGLLLTPPDVVAAWMRKAAAANAQVAIHAIGDRGNRLALDAMQTVLGAARTDRRWRVEHAQTLSPADLPRFAAMGVTASMQPSHAIGDLYFAPARLGAERLKGAYAWNSLLKSGATVCGGSDAPVEKGDPLVEFYAASYRHALNGFAGPDWGLNEAVSRVQALKMFTASAAYAVRRERELGTLEVGKRADVTVFDRDLMSVPFADIPGAKARLTVVGGQVVFGG